MTNERNLNLNRLKYSKLLLITAIVFSIVFNHQFALLTENVFIMHLLGFLFVMVCILGRIYCTAFLGGYKANSIIDYGPFSIVRNPLYIFSFSGVIGLSLMSNNMLIILLAPLGFAAIYYPVIAREEAYLSKHFGDVYDNYCTKVNRVVPSFKNYKSKDQFVFSYKPFESAFKDSSIWILGTVIFYCLSVMI